jgi:hypothetical protein
MCKDLARCFRPRGDHGDINYLVTIMAVIHAELFTFLRIGI